MEINININWNTIFTSFNRLSQMLPAQARNSVSLDVDIRNSLGVIAVVVAENWRFRKMNYLINEEIIKKNTKTVFGTKKGNVNNLYNSAMDWFPQGVSVLKQNT